MKNWKKYKQLFDSYKCDALAQSDIEAKIMKTRESFMPIYNIQSYVDNKHHMISQMDVTDKALEYDCLANNIEALEQQMVLF